MLYGYFFIMKLADQFMERIKKTINRFIDYHLLIRVLKLVSPFKKYFYGAIALAIAMALMTVINPIIVQYTLDNYILKNNISMLHVMVALLMFSLILHAALTFSFTFTSGWLGQSIINQLRMKVFTHLVNSNLQYFDKTPIGTATTRTISDVETINDIFSEGIITIISDLLTVIVVISFMFYTSWKLTLATLAVLPLLIISAYYFKEGIKKSFQEVRTQVSHLNAFLQEHITGMSIVQIFNAEQREFKKFKEINGAHRDANVKSIFYYSVFFPVVEIISSLALGTLLWYWSGEFIRGEVSLGALNAFIICINQVFRPIRALADKFNTLQMGMVAAERVFKLTDDSIYQIKHGTHHPEILNGSIEFKNVSFSYIEDIDVLKNISFKVEAGETLAIVGATGSGKSSIINLLGRYYEIKSGDILIDNINIKDYDIHLLRNRIGVVLQDVFLFSGTVYDNITLKNTAVTREQVIETAKLAGIDEFINKLPGDYDFDVMERGSTLSLGQRQLISFVRALLLNPQIIILDEATSSIDSESERILQNAISKIISNRTSIIIAHRLSTIQKANKILVMNKGEIVEFGSHEELLQNNSYYTELYNMQFAEA
jgi:ATP-binding cassette subfamily B multidrug efflux pump